MEAVDALKKQDSMVERIFFVRFYLNGVRHPHGKMLFSSLLVI